VCGIEDLTGLVRRQEGVDGGWIRHVETLDRMGQDEPVHADHHRQGQLLGESERLEVEIDRLLVRSRIELDPAAVAHRHGIGVVVPDVDRRTDRPVGDRHHDRQPQP
jgi:hypothetical protein